MNYLRKLLLVVCTFFASMQGIWAQTTVSTASQLTTAVQTDNANIQLSADIELGSYLSMDGKTVTIDLNGHRLYRNTTSHASDGHVIYLNNNAHLTLNNSTGTGRIEGGRANNGGAIFIVQGSSLTATNVTFQNNSAANHAGAIWNAGTLTLTNCTISYNSAGDVGGIYNAVVVNGNNTYYGTATLTGCTLTGNEGTSGCGALGNAIGGTSMTLNNCTVTGNIAATEGGGIWNGGTLTVNGGSITGNSCASNKNGGGIFHRDGTLNMSGATVVSSNTKGNSIANNLYLYENKVITVTGAFTTGACIGLTPYNASATMTSGYSTYNSAANLADIFFSDNHNAIQLTGGEVTQNTGVNVMAVEYIDADGNTAIYYNCRRMSDLSVSPELSSGWYVLDANRTDNYITVSGDVKIILADGYTLTTNHGITVTGSNSLTIFGQQSGTGALIANGGEHQAGIGSNNYYGVTNCGTITINGGHITAQGGVDAAGIGGSNSANGGSITINGGTVTATGGNYGAGIGGGNESNGGFITINGGTVTATGGERGAGIGGGYRSTGGSIIINGGTVEATGGERGAGIGGGDGASGGGTGCSITINGGSVTATGGVRGAGIGGGYWGESLNIAITGGTISATGGNHGAGIGIGIPDIEGNYSVQTCYITISGGTLNAEGNNAVGIGIKNSPVTLSWTDIADRYTSTSYGGTVTVADGKAFVSSDGLVSISSGTLSSDQLASLQNKTLVPIELHNIHIGTPANGAVTAPATAYSGAQVSLTAIHSPYSILVVMGETSGDEITLTSTGDNTYTFTMPTEDVTVTIVSNFYCPTDLAVSDISLTEATASWSGNAPAYNIRYRINQNAIVTLTAGDFWDDGSGYQMLLDADATAYGTIIPKGGPLTDAGDASAEVYAAFEYKIPENADGSCSTQNMVQNNSVSIKIPAGTYDWCITNPTPGNCIWIAANRGNVGGRQDNYVFEAGKVYKFTVSYDNPWDRVNVSISSGATAEWGESEWTVVENVTSPYIFHGLDEDAVYEVQVQAVYESEAIFSDWSPSVFFHTVNGCATPSELNATNLTPASATLNWTGVQESYNIRYRTEEAYFLEDFKGGAIPEGWTTYAKGDGNPWTIEEDNIAYSYSYYYYEGEGVAYNADNWLVTPQVELGGTLRFWLKSNYSDEYQVLLSTTGNTIADFTTVLQETTAASGGWEQISIDLSSYAGQQGYIAIRHIFYNGYYLAVDDISLIRNNWVNVTSDRPTLAINGLTPGTTYEWQVQGNHDRCDEGITPWSKYTFFTAPEGRIFTTDGNWNEASNWTPAGVPTSDDDVYIAAAATIPSNYDAQYKSITIEDGGQLIHSNEGVTATVKKSITGHDGNDNGGWNFIATPIAAGTTPSVANGLIAETATNYDLYYYDEDDGYWRNFKGGENPNFNLSNGQGYLYANYNDVELQFEGILQAGTNGTYKVSNLSYDCENESKKGFNLVGNPFACNATIDQPFYVINGRNVVANTGGSTIIPPCTGVVVKATASGQSVTFTKTTAQQSTQPSQLQLTLAQQETNRGGVTSAMIDNAIVSFSKGDQLEKFHFGDNAQIFIPQGNKDYAIAFSEGRGEMPLNFKATKNGTYTISVNPENVEMKYLHLIDNLTGADVDLLPLCKGGRGDSNTQASYTFTAKTTDYASRFRLVFSICGDANSDNETFAFISNGEIIINGEGTIQVIDMLGRVIVSVDGRTRCVPTAGMTSGVYVLRLTDGENVKTQKIIIR